MNAALKKQPDLRWTVTIDGTAIAGFAPVQFKGDQVRLRRTGTGRVEEIVLRAPMKDGALIDGEGEVISRSHPQLWAAPTTPANPKPGRSGGR